MNTNTILHQFLVPCKEALEAICQQYHVAKLYVFGSATTHAFQPDHSDIDLIVQFENLPWPPEDKGQLYWDLLDALEKLSLTTCHGEPQSATF